MIRVFKEENWSQVESFKVIDDGGRIGEGEGVRGTRDVIATFGSNCSHLPLLVTEKRFHALINTC